MSWRATTKNFLSVSTLAAGAMSAMAGAAFAGPAKQPAAMESPDIGATPSEAMSADGKSSSSLDMRKKDRNNNSSNDSSNNSSNNSSRNSNNNSDDDDDDDGDGDGDD